MPYGDIDLGQHWLRWWLAAWRHHAITSTNVVFSSISYLQNQLEKVCCVFRIGKNFNTWIFGNFFKFVTLTLACVHEMWMLKFIPHLSFYCSHFLFSMMIFLDGLLNVSSRFGQNCNFLFLAIFFNHAFSLRVCGNIKDKVDSSAEFLLQSLWTAWNLTCRCIQTTFRIHYILVIICWFYLSWQHFDFVKQVKFAISRHFRQNARKERPEICHVHVFWPPSELITFWSRSVIFAHVGGILT